MGLAMRHGVLFYEATRLSAIEWERIDFSKINTTIAPSMKPFYKFLSLVAIMSLALAPLATGGEVKKKPLKIEQAVQLFEEQEEDFKELKHTEAGRQRGGGLLGLALAAAAGYYISQNVDKDDVKEKLGISK